MLLFEFFLWLSAILKLDFLKVRDNPVVPGPRAVWNWNSEWTESSARGQNFCVIFLSSMLLSVLSILITKLQLEWGNCLFYCHSQHFIAGWPFAAKICKVYMPFHRFFNDRLKVLRVINPRLILLIALIWKHITSSYCSNTIYRHYLSVINKNWSSLFH